MNPGFSSSIAPILAAPWQQRRNRQAVWGAALIVALCALAPLALFVWSLVDDPLMAPMLRSSAALAGRIAVITVATAWWAVLVNNVLEQNHPTLARIVPEHPRRLRAALLVAGAGSSAAMVGLFGGRVDALACASCAAPALAILAASVRWPWLWLGSVPVPYLVAETLHRPSMSEIERVALRAWQAQPEAITAALVAASGLLLASLIQSGGPAHAEVYERRRSRLLRMQAASRGERVWGPGARSVLERLLNAPYYRWMARLLARPASSPRARTLLGLGPAVHWTGNVAAWIGTAVALGLAFLVVTIASQLVPGIADFLPMGLSGVAIGAMFGLLGAPVQVHSRLHQTHREQALLALLPGVPQGRSLNRWLAAQMTAQFLVSWVGALVLMSVFSALAQRLHPNPFALSYAAGRAYMVVATLPLVVFQWRRWARLSTPSSMSALAPTLAGMLLAALAGVGTYTGVSSLVQSAVAFVLAALAWCAFRWWRMGSEPSAFPLGRLA